LQNPVEIFDDVVVPDADHAITEGAQRAVAMPVFGAFRVLAAVELDNQAPLSTNAPSLTLPPSRGGSGRGRSIDRLLASEFETAEAATANACPQSRFCRRERAPQ